MAIRPQDQDSDKLHALADSTDKVTARRANIVLLAADGCDVPDISKTLGVSERTIRYVMQKFKISGATSIERQSPPGRRRIISAPQKVALIELINQPPQDFGIPKDEWTLPALIDVVVRESIIEDASRYTIRREITRCLEEQPGLREHVRFHSQDRPGAPVGNQNAVRHGAYSGRELSDDERTQIADLTQRLLNDFPRTDEAGIKLAQTIADCYIRMQRANESIGADAMTRLNGRLRKAIKKLKTKGLQGSSSEPRITLAEWQSEVVEQYKKWEASQVERARSK